MILILTEVRGARGLFGDERREGSGTNPFVACHFPLYTNLSIFSLKGKGFKPSLVAVFLSPDPYP